MILVYCAVFLAGYENMMAFNAILGETQTDGWLVIHCDTFCASCNDVVTIVPHDPLTPAITTLTPYFHHPSVDDPTAERSHDETNMRDYHRFINLAPRQLKIAGPSVAMLHEMMVASRELLKVG